MSKGKINVEADNIFPIIKKFLYSDHEIFLRELVSNAVDACTKVKTLEKIGELEGDSKDLLVKVSVDKEAKTITVSDNGIGMSAEEVEKYLNQVAFSGAEEFLKKYEGQADDAGIIGHFGLGFYSAFMVSDKVEVFTKSAKGGDAVKWTCDGSPEFELDVIEKEGRGTDIVLHIAEDSLEFLEEDRLLGILNKYCKFLPVNIEFGETSEWIDDPNGKKDKDGKIEKIEVKEPRIINNPNPIWNSKPADLTDEDYANFYKELYPNTFEEPLFHIHLNVDYPFKLTGILYFPKLKNDVQLQKNKIQLYSNQVFITDSVENIVPEFLTLLHGVIDSPDIPLNVSRSYLQADGNVKKISQHITKKVADKLKSIAKNNREDFESKWDDIKIFTEYGSLTDEKFFDRAQAFTLFKDTDGKYYTIEEMESAIKETQTDKNGEVINLYTSDVEAQYSFIEKAKSRGYKVIVMDSPLTAHYVQLLESKMEKNRFVRVDSDSIDNLIQKEDKQSSSLSEDQQKELKEVFEGVVGTEQYTVQIENLPETDEPVSITIPEFMRRMKEQQAVGGGMMGMGNMPEFYTLVVNENNEVVSKILQETEGDIKAEKASQLVDLAKLSQNMLTGKSLSEFINRSISLMK